MDIQRELEQRRGDIRKYLETGDIGTHLSMDAALAVQCAGHGWRNTRPEYAEHDQQNLAVYARIKTEIDDIHFKAKEFELRHWMGFNEDDVREIMKSYRRWTYFDWKNEPQEKGDDMRDMWNPSHRDDPLKHWRKYVDRRVRKPLQQTLAESSSSLSATMTDMKALMGCTAGRALLTLQGEKEGRFNGAWVTIIFDEDAKTPRGGIQGQCATRDEGVAMVQAVIDNMPALMPDHEVSIG